MQNFGEQIKCMMGNVKVGHEYEPKFDKTFTHAICKGRLSLKTIATLVKALLN